jgi:uncharacterized protein YicC (UPF0701 family)
MRHPLASMTGFSRTEGSEAGLSWAWELRSVNGRGLDLKMRLPAGFDGLEAALRDLAGKTLRRGNVGATLTVKREERQRLVADPAVLDDLLSLAATIAALRRQAETEAADQPALQRDRMMESLAALLRDQPGLPQERIAQEVALLAIRADVREELDRLSAHIDAARDLLREGAGVGRRFDFLVQEFVRETNTLCSKSASVPLTATGLKLKAVIEQMREQIQNVE